MASEFPYIAFEPPLWKWQLSPFKSDMYDINIWNIVYLVFVTVLEDTGCNIFDTICLQSYMVWAFNKKHLCWDIPLLLHQSQTLQNNVI